MIKGLENLKAQNMKLISTNNKCQRYFTSKEYKKKIRMK